MHYILLLLGVVLFAFGCSKDCGDIDFNAVETPNQIAQMLDDVDVGKLNIWDILNADRRLFSERELITATKIHNRALDLSAEIVTAMETGDLPESSVMLDWKQRVERQSADIGRLLGIKTDKLSRASRAAWAIERARLRALAHGATDYLKAPSISTCAAFARVGVIYGNATLGAAIRDQRFEAL